MDKDPKAAIALADAQLEKFGRQQEIAAELMAKNPSLPLISAIIMAGDQQGAERAKAALEKGVHPWRDEPATFDSILWTVGSYGRLDFAVWALDKGYVEPAAVYKMLPELWRGSDPDDTDPRFRDLWRDAWIANGRKYLRDGKALPAGVLTIYRGQDPLKPGEVPGIAWSLSRETAEKFAKGAALRVGNRNGIILEAKVRKADVWGYMKGRGEEEVIIDPMGRLAD